MTARPRLCLTAENIDEKMSCYSDLPPFVTTSTRIDSGQSPRILRMPAGVWRMHRLPLTPPLDSLTSTPLMQPHDLNSSPAELDMTLLDLGPLAWVLEELGKSLEGSNKALKRFLREAEGVSNSDLAALDAGQLRIARQQLHQAVGALEMVGMSAPALVLRAMEAAVQKFIQTPAQCTPTSRRSSA